MHELCGFLELNATEMRLRNVEAAWLIEQLQGVDDVVDLRIFGSHLTGLATSVSDVDISFSLESARRASHIRGPSAGMGREVNRKSMHRTLQIISEKLAPRFQCEIIHKARHPLVRAVHAESGLEFQIVSSGDDRGQAAYTHEYISEYPQLRSIFFLIKAALRARGLSDTQTGGISSYALFMMIVASFKHGRVLRSLDPVDALLTVLQFYKDLETKENCVSVDPPLYFRKRNAAERLSLRAKRLLHTDPVGYMDTTICPTKANSPFRPSLSTIS